MNNKGGNNVRPRRQMDGPLIQLFPYDHNAPAKNSHPRWGNPIAIPRMFSIGIQKKRHISLELCHPGDEVSFNNLYNEMEASLR